MIVSFSGIDGAGKSTQIFQLESWLQQSGLRTTLVSFWDDIAVASRLRELISHHIFKGESGIGTPQHPVKRRDKNVTSWPVTTLRLFVYLADAISLALRVRRLRKAQTDYVIFDRYIYDELANIPLNGRLATAFMAIALKLIPKPDLAYVIDADPVAAQARKPEYPLEFLRRNRRAYLALAKLAKDISVVRPDSERAVGKTIRQELLRQLWTGRRPTFAISR